ncbi:unnamed protein product [Clonostachys rhizophaga]|uniref:Uncharacterized protein n=1 Tax=Clonostachys rhizophaga TaxID=160324 RepID=A0A9N9YUW0_9HYPO|nr:unnamed protein product [Clonostachys rhizophaga]
MFYSHKTLNMECRQFGQALGADRKYLRSRGRTQGLEMRSRNTRFPYGSLFSTIENKDPYDEENDMRIGIDARLLGEEERRRGGEEEENLIDCNDVDSTLDLKLV